MSDRRAIGRVVSVALIVLGLASASIAGDAGFKVIVHPDNPVTSVDREFLRDAYLKKATDWNHGATIRPVDLSTKFPARDRFTQDVLKKTPTQLKHYWNQQVFSGKNVPPPEANSTAEMIAYVLGNPGAVGYLPADADPRGAKVIAVR